MSNIEHLKKRAKALVRLHRERSYHLACVARETLPKFAKMSDREILSADFKLSDAQTLVARHEGFEDWSALIARAGNAPDRKHTTTAAPAVLFAVPILYVSDVRHALACYADVLGFDILQTSGDPPFYAEVRRATPGWDYGSCMVTPSIRPCAPARPCLCRPAFGSAAPRRSISNISRQARRSTQR